MKSFGEMLMTTSVADADEIKNIENSLAEYTEISAVPYEQVDGAYVGISGKPSAKSSATANCCYTYVDVERYGCYTIKTCLGQSLAVVFLDSAETVLSSIVAEKGVAYWDVTLEKCVIPKNCVKVGISNWLTKPAISVVRHTAAKYFIKHDISSVSSDVSSLSSDVSSLSSDAFELSGTVGKLNRTSNQLVRTFQKKSTAPVEVNVNSGGAYDEKGKLFVGGVWAACQYTDMIDVQPGEKYVVYTCLINSPAICFFKADGQTLVSSVAKLDIDYSYKYHDVVVPENAYKMTASAYRQTADGRQIAVYNDMTDACNIDYIEELNDATRIAGYADVQPVDGKMINSTDGQTGSNPSTQYVKLSAAEGDTYYFSGIIEASLGIAFFNNEKALGSDATKQYFMSGLTPLSVYDLYWDTPYVTLVKVSSSTKKIRLNNLPVTAPPGCKAISFSTYNTEEIKVKTPRTSFDYNVQDMIDRLDVVENRQKSTDMNYIAFGDSWTYPTGTAPSLSTTTYPTYIQLRTGWKVKNFGKSGSTMVSRRYLSSAFSEFQPGDVFRQDDFSNIYTTYQNDIASADHITFAFGINENSEKQDQLSTYKVGEEVRSVVTATVEFAVGDRDSTEISTIWGAWNTVLSSIYSWNPGVKIGIILNEDVTNVSHIEAYKEIAKWWGMPVLDMADTSDHAAFMTNAVRFPNMNPWLTAKRRSSFADNTSHPNSVGHNARSSVIQKFIERL